MIVRRAMSASLRGCELKYKASQDDPKPEPSASLRGCELKCNIPSVNGVIPRQPPCEAVN